MIRGQNLVKNVYLMKNSIGEVSACKGDLAIKALEAAQKSFASWSKLGINERSKVGFLCADVSTYIPLLSL